MLLLGLVHVSWAVPVSVQVLGPDKKPVPGAQVRALFHSAADVEIKAEPLSAIADAKGTATFECPDSDLGRGGGDLGIATAWSPALSLGSAALKAGANDVTLAMGGTSRGLVVDLKGQPVADVLVRLTGSVAMPVGDGAGANSTWVSVLGQKSDAGVFEARTDASGRRSLGLIPLGSLAMAEPGEDKFAVPVATSPSMDTRAPFDWAPLQASALQAAFQLAAPQAAQPPVVAPNTMAGALAAPFGWIEYHRETLRLSPEEMSKMLRVSAEDYMERYGQQHTMIRLVR